ncbi:hypothetical protein U0X36_04855 [Bacillus thuringiensis]|uniref:hypothetical protein n=1 Tax=Bacillus thuringiensis TaxID=1428 RepID=UPI001EE990A2|nr:hypothetical protein [Bacillus thuringiensis]MDZ3952283.1 hypothetical protein [Bacillus thuringiensis]
MENKRGRPKTITDEELQQILSAYAAEHPGIINYSQLAAHTGIKRHVWSRRMKQAVQKLNSPLLSAQTNAPALPLPNIESIIERYGNNPKKLIEAFEHLNQTLHILYEKNIKLNEQNNKLKEGISQKKQEIKALSATITEYEDMIAGSSYHDHRQNNKLKQNLISISNDDESLSLDFKNLFPNLFK